MEKSLFIWILVSILFFISPAYGQDSCSIRVSCSIPAVPGVNAPLSGDEKIVEKEKSGAEIEQTRQQDKERKLLTQVVKTEDKICYTTYSR